MVKRGLVIERPEAAEAAGADDMFASCERGNQFLAGNLACRDETLFINRRNRLGEYLPGPQGTGLNGLDESQSRR